MPTALPASPPRERRLSLPQTARLLFLVARVRLLDLRLAGLDSRAARRGQDPHGPTLLRLVRHWLAIHERIGALLPGVPEPPHVQEVRVVLGFMSKRCD
ncbi:hypothetical protein [Methylobacterium sp. J-076]|uniref:hypothetical protein n=1 Tax=Methylobacterium sp. J-076 TaxID=2836655 RepID=UPI001FB96B28|nr:hypothetical protein [Methylobacterium sp. J-076]MCJ2012654.1 hypothetical protein [Methylobacterium sp. J-076]